MLDGILQLLAVNSQLIFLLTAGDIQIGASNVRSSKYVKPRAVNVHSASRVHALVDKSSLLDDMVGKPNY